MFFYWTGKGIANFELFLLVFFFLKADFVQFSHSIDIAVSRPFFINIKIVKILSMCIPLLHPIYCYIYFPHYEKDNDDKHRKFILKIWKSTIFTAVITDRQVQVFKIYNCHRWQTKENRNVAWGSDRQSASMTECVKIIRWWSTVFCILAIAIKSSALIL